MFHTKLIMTKLSNKQFTSICLICDIFQKQIQQEDKLTLHKLFKSYYSEKEII